MSSQQNGFGQSFSGFEQSTQGLTGGMGQAFDPDADAKSNAAGAKSMMDGASGMMQGALGMAQAGMAVVLQASLAVIAISMLGAKSPFQMFLRRRLGERYLSEMVLVPTVLFYGGFLVYYWKLAPDFVQLHGFYAITVVLILFFARFIDCIVSGIQRQYSGAPTHSRSQGDPLPLFAAIDTKLARLSFHLKLSRLVIEPIIVFGFCWALSFILFEFLIIGTIASVSMGLFHLIEAIEARTKQLDRQDALIDAYAEKQNFQSSNSAGISKYIGNAH